MKNLITGATGFIGSHIAERLAKDGEEVTALVRKTSKVDFLKSIGVKCAYGNMNDIESLRDAIRGMDVIYHSAALVDEWISPKEAYRVNVEGTKNLLECAREAGVKKFVFVSSLAVLGLRDHFGTKADAPCHKSGDSYIDTKIDAEQLVMEYYKKYGLPVTIVRPGFVFGPRDYKLMPRISEKLRNKQVTLIGSGKNKINAVYIENLTDAIMLASRSDKAVGQKYNVTNDSHMTIEDFISMIADVWGFERPKKHVPKFLASLSCNLLTGLFRLIRSKNPPPVTKTHIKFLAFNLDFDIMKTREDLVYSPRISIEEGLRRTRDWYACLPAGREKKGNGCKIRTV